MLTDIEFRCTWSDGRHDNDVLLTNAYNELIHGRSGKYLVYIQYVIHVVGFFIATFWHVHVHM